MTQDQITVSLERGYRRAGADTHPVNLCEFADGVHATLSEMARNSGFVRAVALRAVAGWITDWRKAMGCIR